MFLLKNPLRARDLYIIGRRLAAFGVQDVLSPLPLRFLTRRSVRNVADDLPVSAGKRLGLFLARQGTAERALAFYLSLYPDITGKKTEEILIEALRSQPSVPRCATTENRKEAVRLLKLFYALCLHKRITDPSPAHFEKWLNDLSDFRLEAAALERLNDAFYEDDFVRFTLPDWEKTSKDRLALQTTPSLRPLENSPDKRKTAEDLVKAISTMLLRDRFMIVPSPALCLCDETGHPFFTGTDCFAALEAAEHRTICSLTEAFLSKNPIAFLSAFKTSGISASFDETSLSELFTEASRSETPAQCFWNAIAANGRDIPFFLRHALCVLKETENLCLSVLQTPAPWDCARNDSIFFLSNRKKNQTRTTEAGKDFRRAFSFERHQKELTKIRGKKLPSFQEDMRKIPEMLSRQTIGFLFKRKGFRFRPVLLPTAIFLAILWLLSHIK